MIVGETISHYKVIRKLGAGGMGVVYEAEDLNLSRSVALKLLPQELSADQESLQRFQREARSASSLNHPNICTIYEVGEFEGKPFLAMELLQGETLGQRLRAKPMAIREIVEFGLQLAKALEAAHAKGIIHRDIKSANIFIAADEQIKVLDFGLAKQSRELKSVGVDASTSDSLTSTGTIVGTYDYMSPEQVMGEKLDGRSDLFSLGIVLYSMATGRPPFTGTTAAAVCDAILHKKPVPAVRLNPELPEGLQQLLDKALEKNRDLRYQSASELAADLKRLKRDSDSVAPPVVKTRFWLKRKAVIGVVLLVGVIIALLWIGKNRFSPKPITNSATWVPITNFSDSAFAPALSPDGRMLTFFRGTDSFFGIGQIYVKLLPDGVPSQLTHDDFAKMDPAFSPDGSRVAYSVVGNSWNTWIVPVLGGEPQLFLPNSTGLSWIPNNRLLFSEIKKGLHMGLVTASESRSEARDIYLPARERGMVHRSYLSPDGKSVLLAEMENDGFRQCRVVPFDGSSDGFQLGPPSSKCTTGAWSPDGKFVYFNSNKGGTSHIWRQAFPHGQPEQITTGPTEEEGIAMAPDGRSFITSVGLATSTIWIHDGKGDRQLTSEGFAEFPLFSSDGTKLYYVLSDRGSPNQGKGGGRLWVVDLISGRTQALFQDFSISGFYTSRRFDISRDGKKIVFASSDKNGVFHIWLGRLDKRAGAQQITSFSGEDSPFFSPSGEIFFRASEGGFNYLYQMREDGSERRKVSTDSIFDLMGPSPDGNFVLAQAASSDEEIPLVTVAFPVNKSGPAQRVCNSPCNAGWSWDAKSFYVDGFAIQLQKGNIFPKLPLPERFTAGTLQGSKVTKLPPRNLTPAPDQAVYAFTERNVHHNLYRVPVPQ